MINRVLKVGDSNCCVCQICPKRFFSKFCCLAYNYNSERVKDGEMEKHRPLTFICEKYVCSLRANMDTYPHWVIAYLHTCEPTFHILTFIRVPYQIPQTYNTGYVCWEIIKHIAIFLLICIDLHLRKVKHMRVKFYAKRHTEIFYIERKNT